jgi:hypothetical protein
MSLSFVVQPGPTDEEKSRQFTQALNENLAKEFAKRGWVSDGKGGWTSGRSTLDYQKLNREMEAAGWITVSNGHYTLPPDSNLLQKSEPEHAQ